MKYTIYIVLFFLGASLSGFSQSKSVKKADKLFAQKAYVEAAQIYQRAKPSQHVLQNLGDSYYYNGEMKNATLAYGNLFATYKDSLKQDSYFRYAQALKAIDDYQKADELMSSFLKYTVDTDKFKKNLNNIVPFNYEVKAMTRSASTGDFGLAYFGNKLVFSSVRNDKNPIYAWNNLPYLDLYEGTVSKDGMLENILPFSDEINTEKHESSATFNKEGNFMYFSRTSDKRVLVGEELVATVQLYQAEYKDSIWTNIVPLPFSSDQYSTMHPALSTDEKRLYFSSDMPGTLGSFDLFYVDIAEDGSYDTPVNLGPTVNTPQREQFPYITPGGILYFASDGHQGLGALDLFMTRTYDDVYVKPINLGETINSGMDDFSYIVDEDTNTGYLASNRKGTDNLYSFVRRENPRKFTVEGDVRDKNTKELLPGAIVSLYDENDVLIGQLVVSETGDYTFNSEPNKRYRIEAERDFYISKTEYIETLDDGRIKFNIELEIESYDDAEEIIVTKDDGLVYIQLENIYFDLNKSEIKADAARTLDVLVEIMKKYPRMEVELGAHTDSRASDMYNLRLSNDRALAATEYLVANGVSKKRLRSIGYGERVQLIKCGRDCTEEEHSINRRVEFIITK